MPGTAERGSVVVRWTAATLATLLLVALVVIVAVQSRQIAHLQAQAARDQRAAQEAATGAGQRLDGVESRLNRLDELSKQVFDPQAVAAAVMPSVYQVLAGDFSGSAFAVGQSRTPGKTDVLTAFHVVSQVWEQGGTSVKLERDGKRLAAAIVDVNQEQDIALLRIDTRAAGLTAAPANPAAGEQILVVGAPLGLTDSITTGVVSAVRPREDGPGEVIQFDAPVNPGNSGGPVINTDRQVVGIADAKAQDAEGIGLAIPIQAACKAFQVC